MKVSSVLSYLFNFFFGGDCFVVFDYFLMNLVINFVFRWFFSYFFFVLPAACLIGLVADFIMLLCVDVQKLIW